MERMTGLAALPSTDAALRAPVLAADPAAIEVWLSRDHSAADLLAEAAGAGDAAERAEILTRAWESAVTSVGGAGSPDGLCATLLLRTLDALEAADRLDNSHSEPIELPDPYLAGGDRWAGWWNREPREWPPGGVDRAALVGALRRLPLGPRMVLVLRDAAGLSPAETAELVGVTIAQEEVLLDSARLGLLVRLDDRLAPEEGTEL